jgi:hypothetical protein
MPAEIVRRGFIMHQSIFINDTLSRLNPYYVHRECFDTHLDSTAHLDNTINAPLQCSKAKLELI